jgi:hypothetical protein
MIESPFAGETKKHVAFARVCMQDSLRRGEAPFAMHLLFPQVLDDSLALDRHLGIEAGLAWLAKADLVAVYTDLGVSPGMELAIHHAEENHIPVEFRKVLIEGT